MTNQLSDDGLSSLKYQKLEEKLFPLFTWILVKIPPGPKNPILKEKFEEKSVKEELLGGISVIGNLWKANEDKILNLKNRKDLKELKSMSIKAHRY